MADRMHVKVVGRAKEMLEKVPENEAWQQVAARIQFEFCAIQSGYVTPQVEPGEFGIHEVDLGKHRVAKLCMRRPTQRILEVHLVKLVVRRY